MAKPRKIDFRKALRKKINQRLKAKEGTDSTKFQNIPEGTEWWDPVKGINVIDIIPYVITVDNHPMGFAKGDIWWEMTYYLHSGIGPDERSYVCPGTFKKPCPICEYRARLMKEDYKKNRDEIERLRPRERQLFRVVDVHDPHRRIMLWDISYFLFGKKLDTELREGEDWYMDFAVPDDGLSLKIRFIEDKYNNYTFLTADRIDFVERKKQYPPEIVEQGPMLDQLLKIYSYEALEAIFYGMPDSELEDEEEGEELPPRPRRRERERSYEEDEPESRPRRRSHRDEPEDEPEDIPEDEPEEEPRRKPRRKPDREEPEDEPDDMPEDEPEEEPRRRSGRRPRRDEPEEEFDDEPEKKPSRKAPSRKQRAAKGEQEKEPEVELPKEKCPYGYEFGDADNHDECDSCEIWEKCIEYHDLQQ